MKSKIVLLIILVTCFEIASAQKTSVSGKEGVRVTKNFNFDWKHLKDNTYDTHRVGFIDTDWETVNLPHDAAIFEKVSQDNSDGANGYFPYMKGSYRKHFSR